VGIREQDRIRLGEGFDSKQCGVALDTNGERKGLELGYVLAELRLGHRPYEKAEIWGQIANLGLRRLQELTIN